MKGEGIWDERYRDMGVKGEGIWDERYRDMGEHKPLKNQRSA